MIDYISCLPGKHFGLFGVHTQKYVGIRATAAEASVAAAAAPFVPNFPLFYVKYQDFLLS